MSNLNKKYKIIADSACDATEEIKSHFDLSVIPLTLDLDGEIFVDNEDIDLPNYLEKYENCRILPKSACPTPGDYLKAYEESQGDVYVVTISTGLSGSHNSAVVAKNMYHDAFGDRNIHVFDTKTAAPGQMAIIHEIKKQLDLGKGFDEVVAAVNEFIPTMHTLFVLDKLDQLRKSGRMSLVTATLSSVLNIKLVLAANAEGEIKFLDKARGFKKALQRMIAVAGEVCDDFKDRVLCISHCFNHEMAEYVKDEMQKLYHFKDVVVVNTRGVSTTYAGRNGIIIAF